MATMQTISNIKVKEDGSEFAIYNFLAKKIENAGGGMLRPHHVGKWQREKYQHTEQMNCLATR